MDAGWIGNRIETEYPKPQTDAEAVTESFEHFLMTSTHQNPKRAGNNREKHSAARA